MAGTATVTAAAATIGAAAAIGAAATIGCDVGTRVTGTATAGWIATGSTAACDGRRIGWLLIAGGSGSAPAGAPPLNAAGMALFWGSGKPVITPLDLNNTLATVSPPGGRARGPRPA